MSDSSTQSRYDVAQVTGLYSGGPAAIAIGAVEVGAEAAEGSTDGGQVAPGTEWEPLLARAATTPEFCAALYHDLLSVGFLKRCKFCFYALVFYACVLKLRAQNRILRFQRFVLLFKLERLRLENIDLRSQYPGGGDLTDGVKGGGEQSHGGSSANDPGFVKSAPRPAPAPPERLVTRRHGDAENEAANELQLEGGKVL